MTLTKKEFFIIDLIKDHAHIELIDSKLQKKLDGNKKKDKKEEEEAKEEPQEVDPSYGKVKVSVHHKDDQELFKAISHKRKIALFSSVNCSNSTDREL